MNARLREPLCAGTLLPATGLVLLTLLLVGPGGDFPLNDDWVYATTACTFLEEHQLVRHPFAGPLALVHTLVGRPLHGVFGASFEALRASTLVLAVVTMWAVAKSAAECGASRGIAVLCAATLLANPIFLNLSYTVMSDVSFLALWTLAGLFYLRALAIRRSADIA